MKKTHEEKAKKREARYYDYVLNSKLRELLKNHKKTPKELAKAIENIGESTVRSWLAGYNRPDMEKLVKIADFFGVTVDELLRDNFNQTYYNTTAYGNMPLHEKHLLLAFENSRAFIEYDKDIVDIFTDCLDYVDIPENKQKQINNKVTKVDVDYLFLPLVINALRDARAAYKKYKKESKTK